MSSDKGLEKHFSADRIDPVKIEGRFTKLEVCMRIVEKDIKEIKVKTHTHDKFIWIGLGIIITINAIIVLLGSKILESVK